MKPGTQLLLRCVLVKSSKLLQAPIFYSVNAMGYSEKKGVGKGNTDKSEARFMSGAASELVLRIQTKK